MSKVKLSDDKGFLADMEEFDAMDLPSSPALRASFSPEGGEDGDAAGTRSPDYFREYSRHADHSQVHYDKEAYTRSHSRGQGYAKLHSREGDYTKVYGKSI
ncbi:hypothetical protein [Rhodobacter sp. CZR27]|uniref:hypothetical protein n=1 Tax=Rhodobacter sp. CZR27 TaxID=2033869 RepID=UPI000BBEE13E|nr:hypothetical protein [Rhodobacter sp. CZR27]